MERYNDLSKEQLIAELAVRDEKLKYYHSVSENGARNAFALTHAQMGSRLAVAEARLAVFEEKERLQEKKWEFERRFNEATEFLKANGYNVWPAASNDESQQFDRQTMEHAVQVRKPAPAEKDEVYYHIKDLHERLDQICKKLVELEHGKPSLKGSDFEGMPDSMKNDDVWVFNTKAPASNPEKATEAAFFNTESSKYAPNCKVTVPEGWIIFKGDRKIEWTDKDMLNFVGISISKDDAYLKKLLEEYRNA